MINSGHVAIKFRKTDKGVSVVSLEHIVDARTHARTFGRTAGRTHGDF